MKIVNCYWKEGKEHDGGFSIQEQKLDVPLYILFCSIMQVFWGQEEKGATRGWGGWMASLTQ